MKKVKELTNKSKQTLNEEGLRGLIKKIFRYIKFKFKCKNKNQIQEFKDILFINGCCLPHPQRYRVDHQIEQLESCGISCDKVYYADLTLDLVKYYRGFIFYRCPILPVIEEFIKKAKENNKVTFYDIDDLVFDTKYTDEIDYVKKLVGAEKDLYNDGVIRMGKTLKLCEYGIASTTRLQKEMSKHLKEVYVNRNVASEEMVKYSQKYLTEEKVKDKIIMGYFSGTITHNKDFELIMPTIIKLLKKYDNLYLKIVGLLDLPNEMECVRNKILINEFVDYKELPNLIHSVHINLAPLEDNIFNEAKSENKWTEAALVKVPTIASNVGAFADAIDDDVTGLLCKNSKEWEEKLIKLIEDEQYRVEIGNNAYDKVMKNCITTYSGVGVTNFIKSKLKKNIFFVLPSTNISGGIMVAIKHAMILKKNGIDVTLINAEKNDEDLINKDGYLFVISAINRKFSGYADTLVATMWLTLEYVLQFYNCKNRKYLVQNYETNFYLPGSPEKSRANSTYNNVQGVEYITISKWCEDWLNNDFKNSEVKYAPNGIDLSLFKYKKREFESKIKILIEGNNKDYYKNVDESFKIVDKLDKEKFEIHYLSYASEPKKWYYYDKFYQKIPHEEVGKIYQSCDILIKTSILESFSYPPLEMMATGGVVLAVPNDGNVEYLKDNYNCLFYKQGDIDEAVSKIEKLVDDKNLRDKLIENGLETAKKREWKNIEKDILNLYK